MQLGRPPPIGRIRAQNLLDTLTVGGASGLDPPERAKLLARPGSRRVRERDPRRERRQLLVLRPGRPDLAPQLVDPVPQLVLGDAERRLALLPDRPLRDGEGAESV